MNATAYQLQSGHVVPVDLEDCLESPLTQLTWVHLEGINSPEDQAIVNQFGLCEDTLEDALARHTRSGIEQRNGQIAFIVEAASRVESDVDYNLVAFFLREHLLVTLSMVPLKIIGHTQIDWQKDTEDFGDSVATLTVEVLDSILDEYFPIVDFFHEGIEDLEELIFKNEKMEPVAALEIKRSLLVMRKRLSPIRDTLNSLVKFGEPLVPARTAPAYNDLYFHCIRLVETIDLGRDILSTVLDTQQTLVGNRLNEVMRTLTVISTMMMAGGLIAGIYGMNFKHMPELEWVYGYPFAIGLMVVVNLIILAIFRRRKWL